MRLHMNARKSSFWIAFQSILTFWVERHKNKQDWQSVLLNTIDSVKTWVPFCTTTTVSRRPCNVHEILCCFHQCRANVMLIATDRRVTSWVRQRSTYSMLGVTSTPKPTGAGADGKVDGRVVPEWLHSEYRERKSSLVVCDIAPQTLPTCISVHTEWKHTYEYTLVFAHVIQYNQICTGMML